MERQYATHDAQTDDDRSVAVDLADRTPAAATAESATATIAATTRDADSSANTLTIIGHGTPSSFEITVDGTIELIDDESESATVLSGSTLEGTIESGTLRFRFTGDLADVTLVDRRITGLSPAAVPNVHVDYAAPESRT
ncbi:hypothetical protein HTZ84_21680 [Haloterrigena sp. SYSU A558-1]|uniref:Uncharacterized protein n=1 Tax=Haloterrigena gelatinilytica TaxID=2741724 RepID=A0A8J8GQE4_9EURY|nr:hypothetical protein [Haloterrigena gelatinilytica]NUB93951.1 hypothetical protein [Haloterrigena gelatinilytica]NUC74878.1 hypothetical protein [Haloterrigena gelatinilytica]